MNLHMSSFLLTLFISSIHVPVYCVNKLDHDIDNKSNVLSDEEQQFINDARKILSEFMGFNSVKECTLHPKRHNSQMIYTILYGSKFELESMLFLLETECYPKHYERCGSSLLYPYVTLEYIEEIFQNHTSSKARVNAFKDTLIPLVKKLSELFLTGKIK